VGQRAANVTRVGLSLPMAIQDENGLYSVSYYAGTLI